MLINWDHKFIFVMRAVGSHGRLPGGRSFRMGFPNTRKLLELINEFSKVAGYEISMQKSVAFLYTNNRISGREIKETIPFTAASKRIRYLEINLPKEAKYL